MHSLFHKSALNEVFLIYHISDDTSTYESDRLMPIAHPDTHVVHGKVVLGKEFPTLQLMLIVLTESNVQFTTSQTELQIGYSIGVMCMEFY